MSNIKDQFAAEEACMAAEEAELAGWRVELRRLQKAAEEKARWEAEEEQRWREEEVRAEEEWKWKEEEERQRVEERSPKEVEEWKRADKEKKQKEEELWKIALEKQKQSEMETRQETGETEEDLVAEVEWKQWAEAQLHEKQTADQMTQAAQAESSKQTTQDFAQAALAYWRSQGMAPANWPYVHLGPIGTNQHISFFISQLVLG